MNSRPSSVSYRLPPPSAMVRRPGLPGGTAADASCSVAPESCVVNTRSQKEETDTTTRGNKDMRRKHMQATAGSNTTTAASKSGEFSSHVSELYKPIVWNINACADHGSDSEFGEGIQGVGHWPDYIPPVAAHEKAPPPAAKGSTPAVRTIEPLLRAKLRRVVARKARVAQQHALCDGVGAPSVTCRGRKAGDTLAAPRSGGRPGEHVCEILDELRASLGSRRIVSL
mmetsp:Transcript_137368/g.342610  ORF Transcript_137368/g.342610 Transcript_137368/m.342610 type:complete len:227 (+) Transcript_137368:1-681(+)